MSYRTFFIGRCLIGYCIIKEVSTSSDTAVVSLMSLISGPYLVVGDEENFLAYEERVVYEMQKILRAKEGN